uniref:Uncharacterized protein n=1 Tax=Tetranychus urticae TaxID=32264 RepID=A0A158P4F8_TETUR
MNLKRKFCPNDCDLRSYYINQAGRGLSDIKIFRGNPYQTGYGFGTFSVNMVYQYWNF